MSDSQIFREVDEAVRHEQYKKLWDKYGIIAIGAAVLIVGSVAGYKGWNAWQASRSAAAGGEYMAAVALAQDKKPVEARKALEKIVSDAPGGYQVLAQLRLAAEMAKAGDKAGAVRGYDFVAADTGVDEILRGFARVQAAMLRIDDAKEAEIKKRLDGMSAASNPWRHSAREYLGLAAWKAGNHAAAEQHYQQSLSDPTTPAGIRQRAEVMLALIIQAGAKATK